MPRDALTYLSDILESCDAISTALSGLTLEVSNARPIVDFCNQLTHEYPTVDDALVWAIANRDERQAR